MENSNFDESKRRLLIKQYEESTLKSAKRALNDLLETEEITSAIAEEHAKQGEQLVRVKENVIGTSIKLKKSKDYIRSIKTFLPGFKRFFKRSKPAEKNCDKDNQTEKRPDIRNCHEKLGQVPIICQPSVNQTPNDELGQHITSMAILSLRVNKSTKQILWSLEKEKQLIDEIKDRTDKVDFEMGKQIKVMEKLLK